VFGSSEAVFGHRNILQESRVVTICSSGTDEHVWAASVAGGGVPGHGLAQLVQLGGEHAILAVRLRAAVPRRGGRARALGCGPDRIGIRVRVRSGSGLGLRTGSEQEHGAFLANGGPAYVESSAAEVRPPCWQPGTVSTHRRALPSVPFQARAGLGSTWVHRSRNVASRPLAQLGAATGCAAEWQRCHVKCSRTPAVCNCTLGRQLLRRSGTGGACSVQVAEKGHKPSHL